MQSVGLQGHENGGKETVPPLEKLDTRDGKTYK